MRIIDMNGWTMFSERPASKNYRSPDDKWLFKEFTVGGEEALTGLKSEQYMSNEVSSLGIKTPKVGDIVTTISGTIGILYENVKDKKSLSRAISEDESLTESYIKYFAESAKKIHTTKCDTSRLPSCKNLMLENLELVEGLKAGKYENLKRWLSSIPEPDTCLHGDLHPGNFIIARGEIYAIDLSYFSYGTPEIDLGQWYFMSHMLDEQPAKHIFHTDVSALHKWWDIFVKYYYDNPSDSEKAEIEKALLPYAVVSSLICYKTMPPARISLPTGINNCDLF